MPIKIDESRGIVTVEQAGERLEYPIDSPEAFRLVSEAWLRCGWDTKYVYGFSWLGRPIIQLPEDMFRIQEVVYKVKPDVIIETGIAHGGSLVFYASLCVAMGRGRVIGVDIDIRSHNRRAIASHELAEHIATIDGDSTDPMVIQRVQQLVNVGDNVLVVLDSKHTKAHVAAELEAYAPLVSVGSYIVATDGIMASVAGAPRTHPDWTWDNPREAAKEFVQKNPAFAIEEPTWPFNEGLVRSRVTYWPDGFIRRLR